MKLSSTRIVGPEYRFVKKAGEGLYVEYEHHGKQHADLIGFRRLPQGSDRAVHLIVYNGQLGRIGNLQTVITSRGAYFDKIHLDPNHRGRGLSAVLINIMLACLAEDSVLNPEFLYVNNLMSKPEASLAAFSTFLNFGFNLASSLSIRNLMMMAERGSRPSSVGSINGAGGNRTPILMMGGVRLVFFPALAAERVAELAQDIEGLERLLYGRQAFIAGLDYELGPEARQILPDYIKLLPKIS